MGQPDEPACRFLTRWGAFEAVCPHPYRVEFSSGTAGPGPLNVEGRSYSCFVALSRRPLPEGTDAYERLALGAPWHARRRGAWQALRGTDRVAPDEAAIATFHVEVLPTLRGWLDSAAATALLREGDHAWRALARRRAADAEANLVAASQRLQAIRARLDAGEALPGEDDTFLRHASQANPWP